jgi:hypothetical protein
MIGNIMSNNHVTVQKLYQTAQPLQFPKLSKAAEKVHENPRL